MKAAHTHLWTSSAAQTSGVFDVCENSSFFKKHYQDTDKKKKKHTEMKRSDEEQRSCFFSIGAVSCLLASVCTSQRLIIM